MMILLIKTWLKKMGKKSGELFKEFSWKALRNSVVTETILTVITVTVTVALMKVLGG